jgi:IclR family KDG regulon transcriptional repressor
MRDPSDYNVRAVERALQILECFDDRHPERGVSEISEKIGLHKATTHRILTTLMNYGYIERAADGQKYRLGLRLSELGFKVVRRMDLRKEALPLIQQLLDQLGETCDLSIYDHGRVFYLDVLQSRHAVTVSATPGQRLPIHCTASGKLFLAYLPAEVADQALAGKLTSYTPKTITSLEQLHQQMEGIRQQGYSVDDQEFEIGLWAVSAPVLNQRDEILAAVSVLSPTSRITPERSQEIIRALTETTRLISRRFGRTV